MLRSEVPAKVEHLLATWNAGNLDEFVALLAPDVTWHDLGMPQPPARGREEVRTFAASILRAFPDFKYTLRAPICIADDGLSCCVAWTINATHSEILDPPGFAPTNRRVNFDGLDYFVFNADGLVQNLETRFDPMEAAAQLLGFDLRPRPGSLMERCGVLVQRLIAGVVRYRG